MAAKESIIWSILDRCFLWVQEQKGDVASIKNQKTPENPWPWLIGFGITVVIFFGLSILSLVLWKKGREVAKLKHQQDVVREEREQLKSQMRLEELEKRKEIIKNTIRKKAASIIENDSKIAKLEKERQRIKEKIDAITSWEDVDRTMHLFIKK